MSIQFLTSFEDVTNQTGGSFNIDRMLGWSISGTDTLATGNAQSGEGPQINNNQGNTYARKASSAFVYTTIRKSVVDNNKLVCAGAISINNQHYVKQTSILAIGGGANKLSFGLNGKFAALYINDVLAATSSVNVTDGYPWFFTEVFMNRSANRVYLLINGAQVADAELPSGFTASEVIVDFGRKSSSGAFFSEVFVYDSVDPIGPVMTNEFFKTGNVSLQFTGNGGATEVNTTPFSNTTYRSSNTSGHSDMFSYTNLLPNNLIGVSSVVGVIHKAVAASGGATAGTLNLRAKVGSTNYDTSVSSSLVSTTPVLVQKIWETNPATSAAWTRSDVQAIQTGYVVAD